VISKPVSKPHKYSAHSQDTNTSRGIAEDGDMRKGGKTRDLSFPSFKSLYYYWLLIILIYLQEYLSNNKAIREFRHGHMSYISWYSVICLITGKSPYPGNLPSIPDYTKYCFIIACAVTVQLPMRVLHGICYSYTSGGDDQSPNVVY
jgi:hypothetical protein